MCCFLPYDVYYTSTDNNNNDINIKILLGEYNSFGEMPDDYEQKESVGQREVMGREAQHQQYPFGSMSDRV